MEARNEVLREKQQIIIDTYQQRLEDLESFVASLPLKVTAQTMNNGLLFVDKLSPILVDEYDYIPGAERTPEDEIISKYYALFETLHSHVEVREEIDTEVFKKKLTIFKKRLAGE